MVIRKIKRQLLGDSIPKLQVRAQAESKEIQDVIFEILCAAFQYTPPIQQSPHPQCDMNYIYIDIDSNFDTMLMQYHVMRKEPLKRVIPNIILEHFGLLPVDRTWNTQQIRILCRTICVTNYISSKVFRGDRNANRDSENNKFQF